MSQSFDGASCESPVKTAERIRIDGRVIERVVHNHLNVKQTEKLIDDILLSRSAPPKGCGKINYINYKIYLNTLKKAFNQVKTLEKDAKFTQSDMGEFLEVKIIIPKGDRCFT